MTRLGEIAPRERAGAETGKRYEYQYQQTARAALTLWTISGSMSVFTATGMTTM